MRLHQLPHPSTSKCGWSIKGLTGTVRSLKAGEVKEFTEVVDRARHTPLEPLIDHARQLGGNAVLGVRFDSSDVGNGLAEIVAYGTAATVRSASP